MGFPGKALPLTKHGPLGIHRVCCASRPFHCRLVRCLRLLLQALAPIIVFDAESSFLRAPASGLFTIAGVGRGRGRTWSGEWLVDRVCVDRRRRSLAFAILSEGLNAVNGTAEFWFGVAGVMVGR